MNHLNFIISTARLLTTTEPKKSKPNEVTEPFLHLPQPKSRGKLEI